MDDPHHDPHTLQVHASIAAVPAGRWREMLQTSNPFVDHAFLRILEDERCLGAGTGWSPRVLVASRGDRVDGALVLFVKGHSMGEFVYDWQWAEFSERNGVPYYPKLVSCSPYSPVGGPRLLVGPELEGAAAAGVRSALVREARRLSEQASGLHVLFHPEDESGLWADDGLYPRLGWQYHWHNRGYVTFEDFLGDMKARRRKEVRRERRLLAEQGYTVRAVRGAELTREDVTWLYGFYRSTCDRYPWGRAYLTEPVFHRLVEELPERVVAFLAYGPEGGAPVAGSFCLFDETTLYGRYWGAREDVPFLHFEACLYAPIAWCIERGLSVFEPGAGGEHKYARGFQPVFTVSHHRLRHPGVDAAIRDFCDREAQRVRELVAELSERSCLHEEARRGAGGGVGVAADLSRL